mmetsp:Transcript_18098/g.31400  ORF Transcript_18098/g.31400 Transcript_18098/m.31400 type:complete len:855 (+) Transcript_18098:82-2646(+)
MDVRSGSNQNVAARSKKKPKSEAETRAATHAKDEAPANPIPEQESTGASSSSIFSRATTSLLRRQPADGSESKSTALREPDSAKALRRPSKGAARSGYDSDGAENIDSARFLKRRRGKVIYISQIVLATSISLLVAGFAFRLWISDVNITISHTKIIEASDLPSVESKVFDPMAQLANQLEIDKARLGHAWSVYAPLDAIRAAPAAENMAIPFQDAQNHAEPVKFFSEIPDSEHDYDFLRQWRGREKVSPVDMWFVRNACYKPASKKFLVDEDTYNKNIHLLRSFDRKEWTEPVDINSKTIRKDKTEIPNPYLGGTIAPQQIKHRVPGVTIFCRSCQLNNTGAHFPFYILPIVSIERWATIFRKHTPLSLLLPFVPQFPQSRMHMQPKLASYAFADIQRIIDLNATELQGYKPDDFICFDEMIAFGRDFYNMIRSSDDLAYLKQNIISSPISPIHSLVFDCSNPDQKLALSDHAHHQEPPAKHYEEPVVYIMNRRVGARRIENLDEVVDMVAETTGMKVVVFDSPNVQCPNGHGCHGFLTCDEVGKRDKHHMFDPPCKLYPDVDDDIIAFNKIHFLITVHGAGEANLIFMPRGSVLVEIIPYALGDVSYIQMSAYADIQYFQYRETNTSIVEAAFGADTDLSEEHIWHNKTLRFALKALPVHVSSENLREVVRNAHRAWYARCGNPYPHFPVREDEAEERRIHAPELNQQVSVAERAKRKEHAIPADSIPTKNERDDQLPSNKRKIVMVEEMEEDLLVTRQEHETGVAKEHHDEETVDHASSFTKTEKTSRKPKRKVPAGREPPKSKSATEAEQHTVSESSASSHVKIASGVKKHAEELYRRKTTGKTETASTQ